MSAFNRSSVRRAGSPSLVCLLICMWPVVSGAASVNYGDFVGATVLYLDVTETANSPGDTAPLFGAPSIGGDQLDFDPAGFSASAGSGSSDITDAQLNFTLQAVSGSSLGLISFTESGDYTLMGSGGAGTLIGYGLSISGVRVFEVDGSPLATPVALSGASVSGGDNLGAGSGLGTPWSLSLTYDIGAALAAAGVPFSFGATRIEFAIDNTLLAISEDGSVAFIAKKDFTINPGGGTVVPLPLPALLLGSALFSLVLTRRRKV